MFSRQSLKAALRHLLPALPWPSRTEAARASLGAFAGIGLCTLLGLLLPTVSDLPLYLVAPLGASAVLVFAVPNSPLAQPWSAVAGNTVSAIVAVSVLMLAPPVWAPSLAVGGAIFVMFLTRSLHPPGGAVALLATLEREAVLEAGFAFALVPVGIMTVTLVLAGVAFNRATGRVYPFRQPPQQVSRPAEPRLGLSTGELTGILKRFNQSQNIGVADLSRLLAAAEKEAAGHRFDGMTCADVMTAPLITIEPDDTLEHIAGLFRSHALKTLPVMAEDGRCLGHVQQADIIGALLPARRPRLQRRSRLRGSDIMRDVTAVAPSTAPVGTVLNRFARQGVQTVFVMEAEKVVGVLTRSDIISLLLSGAEERTSPAP
ncbi:HPP family protein [Henriciella marina]|uniref:HPP family protein n=1 Tax=Henriciella marina TaxID=453851 RepID=A0ABT4LYG0_9PROT|nr:HPP family protein [Henriciella marina]MCZ4299371.1 HPP family protein [Henriciella marina]